MLIFIVILYAPTQSFSSPNHVCSSMRSGRGAECIAYCWKLQR